MEWVKAMSILNNNDDMYPFPNLGDFSGENYSHSRSIASPTTWVALSKKGSTSSAKDWRLNNIHFSNTSGIPIPDSLFITETIPTIGSNYMGIIDHQGKPVILSVDDLVNFDLNNYKKACFEDKSNEQVTLKDSVDADQVCGSGESAINESNLKFKSIKFMSEWVQKNTSGQFILNESSIQEAITQAQRVQCRDDCSTDLSNCNNQCSSNNSTCESNCTTINCINNCASSKSSCDSSCSSDKQNCNNSCDSTHNITGHTYIWFN